TVRSEEGHRRVRFGRERKSRAKNRVVHPVRGEWSLADVCSFFLPEQTSGERGTRLPEAEGAQPGMHAGDLDSLRDAAHDRAVLSEARVVLARRLGVPPGEALQHLIWLARDLDMSLVEAASLLVKDGVSGPVGAVLAGRRAPRAEGGAAERRHPGAPARDAARPGAGQGAPGAPQDPA